MHLGSSGGRRKINSSAGELLVRVSAISLGPIMATARLSTSPAPAELLFARRPHPGGHRPRWPVPVRRPRRPRPVPCNRCAKPPNVRTNSRFSLATRSDRSLAYPSSSWNDIANAVATPAVRHQQPGFSRLPRTDWLASRSAHSSPTPAETWPRQADWWISWPF